MSEPLLLARGIERPFRPTVGLAGVDLAGCGGEIRGLIAENGDGKSTLSAIIAGAHVPDGGSMLLAPGGRQPPRARPRERHVPLPRAIGGFLLNPLDNPVYLSHNLYTPFIFERTVKSSRAPRTADTMSRTYDNHRQNQREWILQATEDLFIDRGIDAVTISDIAAATRLTRVTIYKYFANKELIAQEIYRTTLTGWRERDEREVWSVPGNGFERISHFMENFFTYLVENPREARFVAELNYLYARAWSAEMVVGILDEIVGDTRKFVHDSVVLGIADGSLRPDLDPTLTVAAIFNFNSALIGRIGEMGTKVEAEYGISALAIFDQVWRIFIDGLRPSTSQG